MLTILIKSVSTFIVELKMEIKLRLMGMALVLYVFSHHIISHI